MGEETLIRKPLVAKKVEDFPVEESPVVAEVIKDIPAMQPPSPKQYRCKVKCWVSSKKQMFEPGDLTTFEPGEFIPEHFE